MVSAIMYGFIFSPDHFLLSPSMDEAATKEELRPVKKQLKQLKLSGGDMPRDDKVAILKESLAAIGRRIDIVLDNKRSAGEDVDRWRRHLWTLVNCFLRCASLAEFVSFYCRFVTLFWPKQVKAAKLEEIHAKMVQKEGAPRTSSSSADAGKRPRPSTGVKTNGSASQASFIGNSSHRMNGKNHR